MSNFIPTDDGVQGQKTDKERSTCEEDDHEWEKDCSGTVTESYRRSFTAFHAHVAENSHPSCEKDLFWILTNETQPKVPVHSF